jgi:hypothetical protein
MIHEINPSWIGKTSTEVLKSSGFGLQPIGPTPRRARRHCPLYVLACKIFTNFPFELKEVASNRSYAFLTIIPLFQYSM